MIRSIPLLVVGALLLSDGVAQAQQTAAFATQTLLATDADRSAYADVKARYLALVGKQFDIPSTTQDLSTRTIAVVSRISKLGSGPLPSSNSVCADLMGAWHVADALAPLQDWVRKNARDRDRFRHDVNVACNVAARDALAPLIAERGRRLGVEMGPAVEAAGKVTTGWNACVNEAGPGRHDLWFKNAYNFRREERDGFYAACGEAMKTVVAGLSTKAKETREANDRAVQAKIQKDFDDTPRRLEAEQRERDRMRTEARAEAREWGPQLALSIAVPRSVEAGKPLPDPKDVCLSAAKADRAREERLGWYNLSDAADICAWKSVERFRPLVEARIDPLIARVSDMPRTPSAAIAANMFRLPDDVARQFPGTLRTEAADRWRVAMKPVRVEVLETVRLEMEAAYKGKSVMDASILEARRRCDLTWTDDPFLDKPFSEDCSRLWQSFVKSSCETAISKAGAARLGHSGTLVALSGKANVRTFDLDSLVCAAALDGFAVSLETGLFSGPSLVFSAPASPKDVVEVALRKDEHEGKAVWAAGADLKRTREPFRTGYDILACMQKPIDTRAIETIAKTAVMVFTMDHGSQFDPWNAKDALLNHYTCGKSKQLWVAGRPFEG